MGNLNRIRAASSTDAERLAADCVEIAQFVLDVPQPDWSVAVPYLKLALKWAEGYPVGPEATPRPHGADCLYRRPRAAMVCVVCGVRLIEHPEPNSAVA